MIKVKICGIRTIEAAQAAVDNGADFLGFNFVKNSKRHIEPEKAKEIISAVIPTKRKRVEGSISSENSDVLDSSTSLRFAQNDEGTIEIVGVFQNQSVEDVNKIAEMLNLDFVQLHGDENEEYIRQMLRPVIKKINISDVILVSPAQRDASRISCRSDKRDSGQARMTSKGHAEFFILDRQIQGQGDIVDLGEAAKIAKEYPIFLAGGLRPEDVAEVVQKVRPFAVDVASGIETNGKQHLDKIRKFIKAAKSASILKARGSFDYPFDFRSGSLRMTLATRKENK